MPDFCLMIKGLEFSRLILMKVPNMKFHEKPSSGFLNEKSLLFLFKGLKKHEMKAF
jgi:hypothetical protein